MVYPMLEKIAQHNFYDDCNAGYVSSNKQCSFLSNNKSIYTIDLILTFFILMARTYFVEFDPISVSQKVHLFVYFFVKYSSFFFHNV
jgi:hypothetical protein